IPSIVCSVFFFGDYSLAMINSSFFSVTIYYFFFFFFNNTATTEIYTLSLHDALPIYLTLVDLAADNRAGFDPDANYADCTATAEDRKSTRLNSSHVAISYAVFCLKKKKHARRDTNEIEFTISVN